LRVSDLNEGAEGYLVVILNNTNLITCSAVYECPFILLSHYPQGHCNQDMSKHFQISVHKPQRRRARCWMHRGIPWNGSQLGNLRGWVMHKPSSSPCKLAPRRNLVMCVDSEGPPDCKCSRKDKTSLKQFPDSDSRNVCLLNLTSFKFASIALIYFSPNDCQLLQYFHIPHSID